MAENRVREPFLLVLLTVAVLVALSFVKTDFSTPTYTARKVNVLSEVVAEGRAAKARTSTPVTMVRAASPMKQARPRWHRQFLLPRPAGSRQSLFR